jgi:hypothetical protein
MKPAVPQSLSRITLTVKVQLARSRKRMEIVLVQRISPQNESNIVEVASGTAFFHCWLRLQNSLAELVPSVYVLFAAVRG